MVHLHDSAGKLPMSPDFDYLLHALHAEPTDATIWFALADALEEDDQLQRAELTRLRARLLALPRTTHTRAHKALEQRLQTLLLEGVAPVVPELVNSIGMRFVLVPAGHFRMGSPRNETSADNNEHPMHQVRITRSFYLSIFPVTQAQYQSVVGRNPALHQSPDHDTSTYPVDRVTWTDANAFCQLLNKKRQEERFSRVYRLPTEAEWEYAARGCGCTLTPFAWGSTLSSHLANFDGTEPYGREKGPNLARPCPVGSYLPNILGLYDMHGNIWEWCADWFDDDYYRNAPKENPQGATSSQYRSLRGGGSWTNSGMSCRAARRVRNHPDSLESIYGFRVLLEWPALCQKS
jgi:uncharacterized protein (TIGR02996 family)